MAYSQVVSGIGQVQTELSATVIDLQPEKCSNTPVPFMTDGECLGQKVVLHDCSQYVVEEIRFDNDDDQVYRRLVDKRQYDACPSYVKLKQVS